jgi:hypothetical protein
MSGAGREGGTMGKFRIGITPDVLQSDGSPIFGQ